MTLVAKDAVKEALAVLADPAALTVDDSRRLGAAAFEVLFAIASTSDGAVLEASWNPAHARDRLADLPHTAIEVHCRCPPDVARGRYRERALGRHWIHLDSIRADDDSLWADPGPLGLAEPVIVVDTSEPVDIDAVVNEVRRHPAWTPRS